MARKKRICLQGVTYHVYSRCIEKKPMMKSNKMKDLFIFVLNRALLKYSFELIDFMIMNNHFHLFIRTEEDGETISQIMQYIKSQYAQRYNRIVNRIGPFWNERFGSTIVELTEFPKETFFIIQQYIAFNPVKAKNVQDPKAYRYSGIRCYFDENYRPPVKITLHQYFLDLGRNFKECALKLTEFEERYRKRIIPEFIFY